MKTPFHINEEFERQIQKISQIISKKQNVLKEQAITYLIKEIILSGDVVQEITINKDWGVSYKPYRRVKELEQTVKELEAKVSELQENNKELRETYLKHLTE